MAEDRTTVPLVIKVKGEEVLVGIAIVDEEILKESLETINPNVPVPEGSILREVTLESAFYTLPKETKNG